MDIKIIGGNSGAVITASERVISEGMTYLDIKAKFVEPVIPESFTLSFTKPAIGCYSVWSPAVRFDRQLQPNWRKSTTTSRLAAWMPLHSVISMDGKNRLLVAASDALNPMSIATGILEDDSILECEITFFTNKVAPLSEYAVTIRLDTRDIPYYDAVYDTSSWWESECGYTPTEVPEYARLPMNSLWYSYHQALDVEDIINECKLSKPLGMDTVIIDDGWQTDDSNRGYAYCGDWKVAASKIPNMREFIDRIHETGMRAMVWFSVPFVGIYSENYKRFSSMLLDGTGIGGLCRSLDPRYKEVRDFLVNTYKESVIEWGVDGLKLDFIDAFKLMGSSLEYDERRDYQSLEEAIDVLMTEVITSLKAINNDILIEFRQTYVGPMIRKYGNMLRVTDCPADAILNRQDIINLRFTSGKTAVHSDMLLWNTDDSVESAAIQIASCLYSVPQISMKISKLPEDHKKMLAFYLAFWRENREVLLDGKLIAANPESAYSMAASVLDGKAVFTAYTDSVIECEKYSDIKAVNLTRHGSLIIKGARDRSYTVQNCMGDILDSGVLGSDIFELSVPMAGIISIN